MSQVVFDDIVASTKSGTQLAADLNGFKAALLSMHSGVSRPTYAQAGTMWAKEVSGAQVEIYLFDGANDILLYTYNPVSSEIAQVTIPDGEIESDQLNDLFIDGLTSVSPATDDYVAIADRSDGNKKKKAALSDILGLVSSNKIATRQTVISGPVDSNGLPNFGGSTGSSTVTASGTLIATAANGFGATGQTDRIGSIANPSWTGLTTNGTMYLYLDITADGTCTPGATALAPVYQWGGTYSITSGQFTFNISEMVGKVGNGSAAVQTYRVFVGQVTVASNVVSAITWYALNGRYVGPLATAPASGVGFTQSHALGVPPMDSMFQAVCISSSNGYTPGDIGGPVSYWSGSVAAEVVIGVGPIGVSVPGGSGNTFGLRNASTSAPFSLASNANFGIRFVCNRGW